MKGQRREEARSRLATVRFAGAACGYFAAVKDNYLYGRYAYDVQLQNYR